LFSSAVRIQTACGAGRFDAGQLPTRKTGFILVNCKALLSIFKDQFAGHHTRHGERWNYGPGITVTGLETFLLHELPGLLG
jgi:hypothetical protein